MIYIGQFLQDGKNIHYLSLFLKSRRLVWPNQVILMIFFCFVVNYHEATDLLVEMVKTKTYFFHPVKHQIFDDAPGQTFYMTNMLGIENQRN